MDWLIPANPNKYRVEDAFKDLHRVDWRQGQGAKNIKVDDFVYIYCGSPIQKILFKTKVLKVNIPFDEINQKDKQYHIDSVSNSHFREKGEEKKYMRLESIDYYSNADDYFSLSNLQIHGLKGNPQGPRRLLDDVLAYVEKYNEDSDLYPELVDKSLYEEGVAKKVSVNKYERSLEARRECIKFHGYDCQICGINFENIYGAIGKDFIHVHHKVPLSEIKAAYHIKPVEDLMPVCPNCHAMIHRKINGRDIQIEELQKLFKK